MAALGTLTDLGLKIVWPGDPERTHSARKNKIFEEIRSRLTMKAYYSPLYSMKLYYTLVFVTFDLFRLSLSH